MLDWLQNSFPTAYDAITHTVTASFPWINLMVMILAGCLGTLLCGKLRAAARDVLLRALGLLVALMGASQIWNNLFILQTGQFETTGTILVVFALLIGYALGRALSLDLAIGRLGTWLFGRFVKESTERKLAVARAVSQGLPIPEPKPSTLPSAEGFLLATVIGAFGAPTIRSTLDGPMAEDVLPMLIALGFHAVVFFLLSALYSSNAVFAAIPVLAVEGLLLLAGNLWGNLLTHTLVNQLCLIGAVILVATGLWMGLGKRVRTARFIPAYLIPVVYGLIMLLVNKLIESF